MCIRDRYEGKVYECTYGHTSNSGWSPILAGTLWKERTDLVAGNPETTKGSGEEQTTEDNYTVNGKLPQHMVTGYWHNFLKMCIRDRFGAGQAQIAAGQTQLESAKKDLKDAKKKLENSRKAAKENANVDALLSIDTLSNLIYAQNFSMPAGYIDDKNDDQWLIDVGDNYTGKKMCIRDRYGCGYQPALD